MKVLCIDSEGGRGGSSRSLFYTLINMNLENNDQIEVWHRIDGKLLDGYKKYGIKTKKYSDIVKFWPTERFIVNFYLYLRCMYNWYFNASKFKNDLIFKLKEIDILHCNIETLQFIIVFARRYYPNLKIICHIRTTPSKTLFSIAQSKALIKACNHFIFISPNEKKILECNSGIKINNYDVIFNPTSINKKIYNRRIQKKINIICVSNFSYDKGVDLVLDLAKLAIENKLDHILSFTIIGAHTYNGPFFKIKSYLNKRLHPIFYAKRIKVDKYVKFLGHKNNPEYYIDKSSILIKLTREHNPWGRDVIEAMSLGVPCISIGNYNNFIESNKTGFLIKEFNPENILRWLEKLYKEPELYKNISENSLEKIYSICDAEQVAKKINNVWKSL